MDEEEKPQPKLSTPEIILITLYLGTLDLLGVILVFFLLPDFEIGGIFGTPVNLYLWMKGLPPLRQVIAWLLKFVPYLGSLPLLTIGFWAVVYIDRHPKVGAAAQLVSGRPGKTAGGAAQGVKAATAGGQGQIGREIQERPSPRQQTPGYETAPAYAQEGEMGGPEVEPATAGVSEEEFGVEEEPIEKLIDITRRLPPKEEGQQYEEAA